MVRFSNGQHLGFRSKRTGVNLHTWYVPIYDRSKSTVCGPNDTTGGRIQDNWRANAMRRMVVARLLR